MILVRPSKFHSSITFFFIDRDDHAGQNSKSSTPVCFKVASRHSVAEFFLI